MIGELTSAEMDRLLRSQQLGHLGVRSEDRVYVFPINYGYDGEDIYLHSHEGLKVALMRAHSEVCFQVEDVGSSADWRSVMVHGEFKEVTNTVERDNAMGRIVCQGTTGPPSVAPYLDGPEHLVVYRIRVREMSGRYERDEVFVARH